MGRFHSCIQPAKQNHKLKNNIFKFFFLFVIGKVHGSLARAGKVKGQTAKVEKMEKPKKAKGRAW